MTLSEPGNHPPPIRLDLRDVGLRVISLTGLAASGVLLVDYVHSPVFCDDRGVGCDVVRRWAYAHLGAATLPTLGLLFFAALLGATTFRRFPFAHTALRALGALGALTGVALMLTQVAIIHALCKYCLVVDSSALVSGILAILLARNASARGPRWTEAITVALAVLATGIPLTYGFTRHTPHRPALRVETSLPEAIATEQRPGKATIVEFVDFECPFCRRQQEAMAPVLASYGDRVRLVRRNVPLTTIHPHALDAARAECCADEQHRGDAMAQALFHADDLTPDGCARLAGSVGVDMDTWRACMVSHRPEASLDHDRELAHHLGIHGLPTFWIGNERFEGAQDPAAIRASIDRALAHTAPAPRSGT